MSNRSTVTIDTKTAESIFAEISLIEKRLASLRKRVMQFIPPSYGSDAWWDREIAEAKKEIEQGKIRELQSVSELRKPLKQLFP